MPDVSMRNFTRQDNEPCLGIFLFHPGRPGILSHGETLDAFIAYVNTLRKKLCKCHTVESWCLIVFIQHVTIMT